jgi:hypothetical protein
MINCGTCKHLGVIHFTVDCTLDAAKCLTQEWEVFRKVFGVNYDYKLWEGIPTETEDAEPEKPVTVPPMSHADTTAALNSDPKPEKPQPGVCKPPEEPACSMGCKLREYDRQLCESDCLPQQEELFALTVEPEKPLCFDCPDDLWCGDCVDEERCTDSINCYDCDVKEECNISLRGWTPSDVAQQHKDEVGYADPFECDQGSCDTACDMDCGPEKIQPITLTAPYEFPKFQAEHDAETNSYVKPEPKVEEAPDMIDHPAHYAEANIPSGIECWDWYELAMTPEEFTGHMKGNVLKYIFRAGKKQYIVEDLEKARAYLKRWTKYLNGERTVHMKGKKNDGEV